MQLTVKRVERAAEASGAAQAAAVRDRAGLIAGRKIVPLPPQPLADMLCGAIDGTGVTMTAKETAGREGKGEDGRARTREVKLGYFENNAHRMRYKWFRSRGLFAGSGVAQSGCKAIIGQRLKLSGMRWTVTGADAITTLRCQQASRPEDRIWQPRHNQTVPA